MSRLKYIVKVMNKVSSGNFNVRIKMKQKDEIGQLSEDFNLLIEKINILFKENVEKEIAQKDAQLKALQYQINPHFIYNTIDIFRMKMELAGEYDTAKAITDFGKILRYNINSTSKYTTINEEVQQVIKYVNLQKQGYGSNIILKTGIPEELLDKKMIKFILQPLVENSIKHGGGKRRDATLNITIEFQIIGSKIQVTVSDDGKGIPEEKLNKLNRQFEAAAKIEEYDEDHESIGLLNINERIKLFYGKENHIRMESMVGKYTKTCFYMTIIEES